MVAFWVMELGNLHNVLHVGIRILSGSLVPVWFFPESVQRICNLLPFVYIYQGPLGIYIGKTTGRAVAHTLALQAVWAVLLFALLSLVWRRVQSRVMIQGG
jgi:ABC-2 type transport system permease protein